MNNNQQRRVQAQLEEALKEKGAAMEKAEKAEAACQQAQAARAAVSREALRVQNDADAQRVELEVCQLIWLFRVQS
jgi:hypothetical protein